MINSGKNFRFNSPVNWEHSTGLMGKVSQNTESTFEFFTEKGDMPLTISGQPEWTYTAKLVEPGIKL